MNLVLMQCFTCLPTIKDIWEAAARTFYDSADETCIFNLNQRSFITKQNGYPLSTYYTDLVAIFQDIDCWSASQAGTVDDVLHLHSVMPRLQVHIFLSGLGPSSEQIHGEILRRDPN